MKAVKIFVIATGIYLLLGVVAGIAGTEGSLRLFHRPITHRGQVVAYVQEHYQAQVQDVSIRAADGVVLKGWYIRPHEYNGNVVLLSHGITDNREGVLGYARIFMDHGYAVLLPDTRDHGESGGGVALYGVKRAHHISPVGPRAPRPDPPQGPLGFVSALRAPLDPPPPSLPPPF